MSPTRSRSNALVARRPRDEAAVARVASAAALDLEAIYRAHADSVATWARRLGGPELDVEDLVHEVFLVVQRRLPEWRGEAKVTTWLYEITLRTVQHRRRRSRWSRLWTGGGARDGLAQVAADEPDALGLLERREAGATLYRLLDGVAEKYRTVLVLHELEGKSGEQIAALTHTTLANVWVRLHRGRQKLTERFLAWEAKGRP